VGEVCVVSPNAGSVPSRSRRQASKFHYFLDDVRACVLPVVAIIVDRLVSVTVLLACPAHV
jgi:hypothetical protein